MSFSAEGYRSAASEHMVVAGELYRSGHYVLCHYVAGLAVECILRAYRMRIDSVFDARHDLHELQRVSRFLRSLPAKRVPQATSAMATVAVLWKNEHRHRSLADLRVFLRRAGQHKGIKGDFVKECARRITEASTVLVTEGVQAWTSSKPS